MCSKSCLASPPVSATKEEGEEGGGEEGEKRDKEEEPCGRVAQRSGERRERRERRKRGIRKVEGGGGDEDNKKLDQPRQRVQRTGFLTRTTDTVPGTGTRELMSSLL